MANITETLVDVGTVVVDNRCGVTAKVIDVNYDGLRGSDGYGVVVEYSDDPESWVSTGTDYFDTI